MESARDTIRFASKMLAIGAVISVLYSSVIAGIVRQWWSDENYSHGLLVPLVIVFIVWSDFDRLRDAAKRPALLLGMTVVGVGLLLLLLGTLGAELFTQRVSLVVLIAGVLIYCFGAGLLKKLVVPFVLLLLAIPIPQVLFNKVAFPLQLIATRIANWGLLTVGIDSTRRGNIIEFLPQDGSGVVALEVVEACSGIRSLIALVTLALILRYLSSGKGLYEPSWSGFYKNRNFWMTAVLVSSSIPVALVTNALRVFATGFAAYYFGQQVVESRWHDAFGWLSFFAALLLLIALNSLLSKLWKTDDIVNFPVDVPPSRRASWTGITTPQFVSLFAAILVGGLVISGLEHRSTDAVIRKPLSEFPRRLGGASRVGNDTRFDGPTEDVLRASDYIMRDYLEVPKDSNYWRKYNLYVGYYASQRTGATYHSPQNCLPGAGWELSDHKTISIAGPDGRPFEANRFLVRRRDDRYIMIYWYQGRGRKNSSEYLDKFDTILDSITSGRSDGSMIRVITAVSENETDDEATQAAANFSAGVSDAVTAFVPE